MYFSAILIISDINITLYITINIYIKLLEQESLSSIQIKSKQIIYIYDNRYYQNISAIYLCKILQNESLNH